MIVQYPDEILKTKCREVKVFDCSELRSDIEKMMMVLAESGGIGIAAPQVGILSKIAIIHLEGSNPIVMINPRIRKKSKKLVPGIEECLSIPGRRFLVHRPKYIWFSYTDPYGEHMTSIADGFKARVVLHEFDHLNGIIIVDKGRELT